MKTGWAANGTPSPTLSSCDSDLVTSEEGTAKLACVLAASRKGLCPYSLKTVTLMAIPWKQGPSINFPQLSVPS